MTLVTSGMETLRRMAFAIALLAVAVLSFAPSVEAAVCGYEPAEASSLLHVEPSAADHQGDESGPEEHGDCAHGHCHHRAPGRTCSGVQIAPELSVATNRATAAGVLTPSSFSPAGLEHPPRA